MHVFLRGLPLLLTGFGNEHSLWCLAGAKKLEGLGLTLVE
jgi:hypothetical protein